MAEVQMECPCQQAAAPSDRQLLERFNSCKDGAAFEELVRRHGPMVLEVCRRVLHDTHLAEDAFQATFLVLVTKASTVGRPELLGNWLYGVAYRTALKARAQAMRRSEREKQVVGAPMGEPSVEAAGRELREILDEELSRLPAVHRAPLVLCYLEGKTNEDAARLLGWPVGSMSGRLARARERLRQRLTRRGLILSAALLLLLLEKNVARAALRVTLLQTTVQAAVLTAQRVSTDGVVSASVQNICQETVRALWRAKWRAAAVVATGILASIFSVSALAYTLHAQDSRARCGCCGSKASSSLPSPTTMK